MAEQHSDATPATPDGVGVAGGGDPREEVRAFLASRRARLSPEQAGVQLYGGRRRVPGLRREEVAMLAGVSTDYYVRLEKGNVAGISDDVLNAVSSALQLDEAERTHLFDLARAVRPARAAGPKITRRRAEQVRPGLQWMVDAMPGNAVVITNARLDIVAANALGRAFYAPVFEAAGEEGQVNFARFGFLHLASREFHPDWNGAANVTVAQLRMAAGADPLNKDLSGLVGELATRSEDFRTRWAAHDVRLHRSGVKQFNHPVVGLVEVSFNNLALPDDPGLNLLVNTAEPGSVWEDKLRVLASWTAPTAAHSDASADVAANAAGGARDSSSGRSAGVAGAMGNDDPHTS